MNGGAGRWLVGALTPYGSGAKVQPRGFLGPLGATVEPSALRQTLDLSRSRNASAMASLHEDPGNLFKMIVFVAEPIVSAEGSKADSK